MNALPEWVRKHCEVDEPIVQERIDWIRSRPDCIKKVMRVIPPSCVVMLLESVCHLEAGELVLVNGYQEVRDRETERLVAVHVFVCRNDDRVLHHCPPEVLEVVCCWNNLTPERVAEILEEK